MIESTVDSHQELSVIVKERVDMEEISSRTNDNGGLLKTTLGELRDAVQFGRLGKYVIEEIARKLHGEGLGYFPSWVLDDNEFPRQHQELRVYRNGTVLAELVKAIEDPSDHGDDRLRETALESHGETLDRIRALVCQ